MVLFTSECIPNSYSIFFQIKFDLIWQGSSIQCSDNIIIAIYHSSPDKTTRVVNDLEEDICYTRVRDMAKLLHYILFVFALGNLFSFLFFWTIGNLNEILKPLDSQVSLELFMNLMIWWWCSCNHGALGRWWDCWTRNLWL